MKILVIGAGRMGIRHAVGVSNSALVKNITILDISELALENAKEQISKKDFSGKLSFDSISKLGNYNGYDIAIIATTARSRYDLCKEVVNTGCKSILIEKPLGQSMQEVLDLIDYFNTTQSKAYVNLNMRLYPDFINLKNDLNSLPQFSKPWTISINTGALGIGANGIHYLDYLIYLYEADEVRIIDSDIDYEIIQSSRGNDFFDFGGWCLLEFYQNKNYLGRTFLSMSANSTVFGGWDIVTCHGRISINEAIGKRVDFIRKEDSKMPMNRYHADYLEPLTSEFISPFLGDLSKLWVESIYHGNSLLPKIEKTILSHEIMFEWLESSHFNSKIFPIT